MRERFQVLVIPFMFSEELTVAIFQRSDDQKWQFIAGGGEDNESIIQTAKRESLEEAGIEQNNKFIQLDTVTSIPKKHFSEHKDQKGFWVIPEYCFAVKLESQSLIFQRNINLLFG
ncbi:MAG: NUDIX domain-containing protein [Ignavibacteria bacterium]